MSLFVPQPRRLEASYELMLFRYAELLRINLKQGWVFTNTLHKVPITHMLDKDGEDTTDPAKCHRFMTGTDHYGWGAFEMTPDPTFH